MWTGKLQCDTGIKPQGGSRSWICAAWIETLSLLLLCSGAAKEPGTLFESGGTSAPEPSEDQWSIDSAALWPLVQTVFCWMPAWNKLAEVSVPHHHVSTLWLSQHTFVFLCSIDYRNLQNLCLQLPMMMMRMLKSNFCLNLFFWMQIFVVFLTGFYLYSCWSMSWASHKLKQDQTHLWRFIGRMGWLTARIMIGSSVLCVEEFQSVFVDELCSQTMYFIIKINFGFHCSANNQIVFIYNLVS